MVDPIFSLVLILRSHWYKSFKNDHLFDFPSLFPILRKSREIRNFIHFTLHCDLNQFHEKFTFSYSKWIWPRKLAIVHKQIHEKIALNCISVYEWKKSEIQFDDFYARQTVLLSDALLKWDWWWWMTGFR